jgi:hypothetical protein
VHGGLFKLFTHPKEVVCMAKGMTDDYRRAQVAGNVEMDSENVIAASVRGTMDSSSSGYGEGKLGRGSRF